MKADPNHNGIGPGPNPQPTPGDCPYCDTAMVVDKARNKNTDTFITTFVYGCPDCGAQFIDRP